MTAETQNRLREARDKAREVAMSPQLYADIQRARVEAAGIAGFLLGLTRGAIANGDTRMAESLACVEMAAHDLAEALARLVPEAGQK